jgi:hypothetical protein
MLMASIRVHRIDMKKPVQCSNVGTMSNALKTSRLEVQKGAS